MRKARKATPPTTPPAIAPGPAPPFAGGGSVEDAEVEEGSLAVDVALLEDKNGAATRGFESKNPAVRSPSGHPLPHGFDLQQPMNGGSV